MARVAILRANVPDDGERLGDGWVSISFSVAFTAARS
jgi:hypothetical protein